MGNRILAIDDSHTLRRFIENSLSQGGRGYDVTTAPDGAQGIQKAREIEPDLILLDYLLPDMDGDEVCRQLTGDGNLARIPVIMLSSDADSIGRLERQWENVERALTKPFTKDLLLTTVHSVMQKLEERNGQSNHVGVQQEGVIDHPDLILKGSTAMTSLIQLLRGVEIETLDGTLYFRADDLALQVYFKDGRPVVCSTNEAELYLSSDLYQLKLPKEIFQIVSDEQQNSGCPCFALLGQQGIVEKEEALNLCRDYGAALFAKLWTKPIVEFAFRQTMPSWMSFFSSTEGRVDDWAMSTLRQVGTEYQSAHAWGQPNGVPCFTLSGYQVLQELPLNEKEAAFASMVGEGSHTLEEIASNLELTIQVAERILFRFMCMEIIDYWPGNIFHAPPTAEAEN